MVNNELRKLLQDYKDYTLNLIYNLEKDEIDNLEELLNKRQETIDEISNTKYTMEEFREITEDLGILICQKKLSELMIEKRNEAKEEMNKIAHVKNANYSYNRRLYGSARVFNKKI